MYPYPLNIFQLADKSLGQTLEHLVETASQPITYLHGGTRPNQEEDLVLALAMNKRWRDLKSLIKHEKYGEEAKREYEMHLWMDKADKLFKKQLAAYPEILKKWHRLLVRTNRIPPCGTGIYDVSYPSTAAQREGFGNNYVAISGDGMFLFMFEIVSLEGDGLFKFQHLSSDPAKRSRSADAFQEAAKCQEGDILTGTQILDVFREFKNLGPKVYEKTNA